MEHRLRFYLLCAAVMLLLPAGVSLPERNIPPTDTPQQHTRTAALNGSYRILCTQTGKVSEVPLREYLIGAVGAEMPAAYEPEALKAQVIACHTYAERIRTQNAAHPDAALCGADLSDDSSRYQAYYPAETLHTLYGAHYDEYYAKIAAAVDAVGDLLLCYDDEPIIAAFHAISSGKTESADRIWGTALPYLVTVDSAADCDAPHYQETVSLPPETVRKVLCAAEPDCVLGDDPAAWFTDAEVSPAGTVLQIQAGGIAWNGQRIRELLALRSACFTVSFQDGALLFTSKGFGHNVGMSQYGANALAKQGADYTEILAHYYPNTVLCPISD